MSEGRITITEDGDLILASVEQTDTGDYTCLALNKGGERESAPASLTVLGKGGGRMECYLFVCGFGVL